MANTTPRLPNHRGEPGTGETRDMLPNPTPSESKPRVQVGSYRIVRQLGVGGMGIVYLAEDSILRRQVALKVLHPDPSNDSRRKERFLREARATAALDHDHIVRIYHADEAEGDLFFVMELLKGESLHARLKREHRLKVREAMRIAGEVTSGLVVAHRHGLIQRDITPANLWVETSGRVKILDFGLVHVPEDASLLSRLGAVMGTPGYMSPEQAAGEAVTYATDLFSLGCVLYQMVTGEKAFHGDSPHALMRASISDNPRSPREINPEIPEPLDRLIVQMLAKAEHDRPKSAQEVGDRLTDLLEPDAPKRQTPSQMEEMVFGAVFGADSSGTPPTHSDAHMPTTPPDANPSAQPTSAGGFGGWIEHAIAAILLLIAITALGFWWRMSRDKIADGNPPPAPGKETSLEPTEPGATIPPDANRVSTGTTGTALDPKWVAYVRNIADLRARYAEVSAELKRRNPGLTGIRSYADMGGTIRSFEINSDNLEDLTPLRALPSLQNIIVRGSNARAGRLKNLEPLRGMGLVMVDVENTQVSDLLPLEGMHLNHLNINGTAVTDLSPLKKLAELESIVVSEPIRLNLAPLRGLKGLQLINGHSPDEVFKR